MSQRIVLAGSLAQLPGRGGHTWVFLQYLLGLRRLGCEVTFVDWLDGEMVMNGSRADGQVGASANWRYLSEVMDAFGLDGCYALLDRTSGAVLGMSRERLVQRVRGATLINVMGFLSDEQLLEVARTRVFLDIDPGFPQMWRALGLADVFAGHDAFVTVAQQLGSEASTVPDCGLDWIATWPPVVLEQWPVQPMRSQRLVGIGAWRGSYGPVEYDEVTYGLRVHEFRRFIDLPRMTSAPFELALDIEPGDWADRERLVSAGWQLVDPLRAAGDPWAYRDYVAGARAEFGVAKAMYVRSRGGWFSDRSACFLASGRPVIAQDTGIGEALPSGAGLLLFDDLQGAASAVEEVARGPERQGRAARELAEAYFDSDRVLTDLLERVTLR